MENIILGNLRVQILSEEIVRIERAGKGGFEGERAYHAREISVKFHCLKDAGMVRSVTVNGEEVPFKRTKRDTGAFPLDTSLSATDAYVVGVLSWQTLQKSSPSSFSAND